MLNVLDAPRIETPEARLYRTPLGDYPSMTTVLGATADKAWLERWRKWVGEEEAERLGRVARVRGTKLHDAIEQYIQTGKEPKGLMPNVLAMFMQAKKLIDRVDEVLLLEAPLWSDVLRIAGTVDMVCRIQNGVWVVDFKNSAKPKESSDIEDYRLQVCGYSTMFEERYDLKVVGNMIWIMNDGAAPQVFVEEDWRKWSSVLADRVKFYYGEQ